MSEILGRITIKRLLPVDKPHLVPVNKEISGVKLSVDAAAIGTGLAAFISDLMRTVQQGSQPSFRCLAAKRRLHVFHHHGFAWQLQDRPAL